MTRKQASLEDFIAYAKDTFGVELTPKKSDNPDTVEKLFHVMREPTPEEYAAMDKLIKNMSYDTGVTFEGLINHERYVSVSVLDDIKAEMDKLDFYNHTKTIHNMIDEVWDKHLKSLEEAKNDN